MPIYEFYSPDTHKIYSFFAKTLAQADVTPKCPDDPRARMVKMLSGFTIGGGKRKTEDGKQKTEADGDSTGDAKMEAAMSALEREFSNVDESDPKAMARMMRRMAELSGEKLDEPMEEAVRKLEEGADPDALEEQLGDTLGPEGEGDPSGDSPLSGVAKEPGQKEPRARYKSRRLPPVRDPKLYDYE
jgi:hypothetical protein